MRKTTTAARPKKTPCGLCGQTRKLRQTECCGQWICDDEHQYVMFSYARNSCSRNHSRYTLCGYHHAEGHTGNWQKCQKCRTGHDPEMVAWYGTNEYNFEKLPNPPVFAPTTCSTCQVVINLGQDGYTQHPDGTWCERCAHQEMQKLFRHTTRR